MSSRRSKSLSKPFPESMTLIIDKSDNYSHLENYFYINSSNLLKIKNLSNEQFSTVTIKNTQVELITPLFLTNLFAKMKIKGKGEIIISEPISVMQSYEAKIIIANLKIGGFDEIKLNESLFFDERVNKKIPTLSVTFIRSEKRGNLQEEIYKKNENRINNTGGNKRRSNTQNKNNNNISNRKINDSSIQNGKKLNNQNISPSKLIPANRKFNKPIEDNNNNASRGNSRRNNQNNVNDRSSKYSRRK
jgi:hypothetical protein